MGFFFTDGREHHERRFREAKEDYLRRMSAQDGEDEDDEIIDEDEFCEDSAADELIDTLKTIERHRAELEAAARYFEAVLDGNPDLRQQWQEFTRGGGVSSGDFRRFLDGKVIRYRPTRHRKHLRLVVNQRKPTVIRRPRRHGDDAA